MIRLPLHLLRFPRLPVFSAGETFRVLKKKEQAEYSEYGIRRLVLEAWSFLPNQT